MWRFQRKDILFVLGLVGIALEEARAFGEPSEVLLLVFAAMCGFPLVWRADEARSHSADEARSNNGTKSGQGSSDGDPPPSPPASEET